jgi:hypothetical protein
MTLSIIKIDKITHSKLLFSQFTLSKMIDTKLMLSLTTLSVATFSKTI